MSTFIAADLGPEDPIPGSPEDVPDAVAVAARSPMQLFWRRLRRDKVAMTAMVVIGLVLLIAIFAPLIVSLTGAPDPNTANDSLTDDFGSATGPTANNWFGVDSQGRDVFSRVIYGARVSMLVAFLATALTMVIGVTAGLLAGYFRGWVDTVISRIMELFLAFPVILLAVGIGVACAGLDGCLGGLVQPGLPVVIGVIAIGSWPYAGRLVRGQVLSLREKEFVDAARSLGAGDRRIIVREILPNLLAPMIVWTTVLIPTNILYEASLSFLGVGVDAKTPSWGQMLSEAAPKFAAGLSDPPWWWMAFPGIALLLIVLAFNILGDAVQDALNPRTGR